MTLKEIIKKVRQIELYSYQKAKSHLMGDYQSASKGQGMVFSEVRAYQYGDEIRRIDWNKTARFQSTFVKVMEEEKNISIMLLVDISSSMDYGTRMALKREFIAEICASIGFSAIKNQDKVGLILYADKVYKMIPPKSGRKHILSIISSIITAEPVSKITDLTMVLEYMMNVFKRKTHTFIFSDFQDNYQAKKLKMMAQKHSLFGVRIFDEKDMEIPNVGYTFFTDIETGEKLWVNTSNAQWRYRFSEEQKQKFSKLLSDFQDTNSVLMEIKTGEDYVKIFRKFLKIK